MSGKENSLVLAGGPKGAVDLGQLPLWGWGVGACRGSGLLQLHISYVEVGHVLVGGLEAPGDVLVHGAVIKVQALERTRGGAPQYSDTGRQCPSSRPHPNTEFLPPAPPSFTS